jgi:hypothetical protein
MSPRERGKALRADQINLIRPDLDKRTPDQVAKAESGARKAVDRNSRDDGEKTSFLGFLFGGKK